MTRKMIKDTTSERNELSLSLSDFYSASSFDVFILVSSSGVVHTHVVAVSVSWR